MCGHNSASNNTQSEGAESYHVRVGLQYETGLFPPLLSVVVLKHITQTLKTQTGGKNGCRDGLQVQPVKRQQHKHTTQCFRLIEVGRQQGKNSCNEAQNQKGRPTRGWRRSC